MTTQILQFVTFEQAKRLKKIGFVWDYEKNGYNKQGELLCCSTCGTAYNCDQCPADDYPAPYTTVALKWFRDDKNLTGYVDRNAGGWYFAISKADNGTGIVDSFYEEDYNTYEEAEQKLLDKLLTLI